MTHVSEAGEEPMQEVVGTDASPYTSAEDAGAGNLQHGECSSRPHPEPKRCSAQFILELESWKEIYLIIIGSYYDFIIY